MSNQKIKVTYFIKMIGNRSVEQLQMNENEAIKLMSYFFGETAVAKLYDYYVHEFY